MNGLSRYGIVVARVLLSVVFVLNGLGIIDQTVPLKELMEHGLPVSVAHLLMMAARVLEFAAGLALALGVMPRLPSLAPLAFLVPATFVSHSFWQAAGTPAYVGQLINFSKNVAMGGVVFVVMSEGQPSLLSQRRVLPAIDDTQISARATNSPVVGVKQ